MCLCIFDNFKAQLTNELMQILEDNNVDVIDVPSNCTDCIDLDPNKPRDMPMLYHTKSAKLTSYTTYL